MKTRYTLSFEASRLEQLVRDGLATKVGRERAVGALWALEWALDRTDVRPSKGIKIRRRMR